MGQVAVDEDVLVPLDQDRVDPSKESPADEVTFFFWGLSCGDVGDHGRRARAKKLQCQ